MAVLQAINRHRSLTMMEIARESRVPYPTACRILQTLLHEGFVEREPTRKRYRATVMVRSLACGFQEDDAFVAAAREPILALGRKVVWPISLCTRVGAHMMVRDSTHALSPLTFQNYHPGYTLPILECATGKAYLAFADPAEVEAVLAGLDEKSAGVDKATLQLARSGALFTEIRERGYAALGRNRHNATPGKTSSIAVPVVHRGAAVGALALIFFASAMSIQKAVEQHLRDMQETAGALAGTLTSLEGAQRGA
jgi:IclR family mhp operon transcriptional activator